MDHDLTRPSLLSRVRDGSDQAAWREFEAKYRELLMRYCRARGLQQSDADDVRQLVMMNLAQSLRNFEYSPEKGRFRSYLGRVVRNSISRYFSRPNTADRALDTAVIATVPDEDPDEKTAALYIDRCERYAEYGVSDEFELGEALQSK